MNQDEPKIIVNEIPEKWVFAEIGVISKIVRGISFPKDSKVMQQSENTVACLRTANVQKEVDWDNLWFVPISFVKRDEQFIQINDILISTANSLELLGKVSQVKKLPYISTLGAFISLIRVKNNLDPKFIYYRLLANDFRDQVRYLASTTTNISNISISKLQRINITFPPLPEQERIVAKIETLFSELDAGVQSLKRAQTNLKRYKASVLKAACEGSLVPTEAELARQEGRDYEPAHVLLQRILRERRVNWEAKTWQGLVDKAKQKAALKKRQESGQSTRVNDLSESEWVNLPEAEYQKYLPKDETWKQKYPEPAAPDTTSLPDLPEGWVWASVDYLTETIGGVTKGKNLSGKKIVSLPYLRVANVQRSYLNLEEIKNIDVEEADLNKYRLRKGDLLLTEGGDADKLGRSAIWNDEIENCIHQNHIFRARPIDNLIDSKWLMIITNSEFGRSYFLESSKQTTNLASINLTQLRSCPIPLPPLLEQNRIINEYERILSLEMEINNSINFDLIRAERLRQSILKRAFEGKLVPQDPNDEPASELLISIQTQKETGSEP